MHLVRSVIILPPFFCFYTFFVFVGRIGFMRLLLRLLCIWFTKIVTVLCRLIGHNGSNAAGKVVVRVYPRIISDLAYQVRNQIIVVCGTNGKTTTNNMIDHFLTDLGYSVVCNRFGANMTEGVMVALIQKCNWLGKLDADFACFEIDEGYAKRVFDFFEPHVLVLNNLFRDQLDRYGEIDSTMHQLRQAFEKLEHTTLLVNGDDPLCVALARESELRTVYYGIDEDLGVSCNETKEGQFCRFCGEALQYDYYQYSQLGHYHCDGCGFVRPQADFSAQDISFTDGMQFSLNQTRLSLRYRGIYNIYNVLAAVGALSLGGVKPEELKESLASYQPQPGRMEEFSFPNKKLILNLCKNPAGFNQGIATVALDTTPKEIILAVNDKLQDGTDVTWLWDVDFEKLKENVCHIQTCGMRRWDLSLRLKYADFSNVSSEEDMRTAIQKALEGEGQVVYALVNYSMLFPTRAIIEELLRREFPCN